MKFEVEKLQAGEIQFNIKYVIESVFENVKWVLLGGVVIAFLLTGVIYYKDIKDYENTIEIEMQESDYEAVNNYLLTLDRKQQLDEYAEESLLLQMDFRNVHVANLSFYITANEQMKKDVVTAVYSYINGGIFANDIAKLDGFPKENYIREVFSVSILTPIEENNGVVILVDVYGVSEDECQRYVNALKTVVNNYSEVLLEKIGAHQISIIKEEYANKSVDPIYTSQKNFYQSRVAINTELENLKNTLSVIQVQYLFDNGYEIDTEINQISKPSIQLIYAIIGFIVGCICVIGVIGLKILLQGRIQTDDEILRRLDINCYGKIDARCNKVFARLTRQETSTLEKQVELIALKINRANVSNKIILVSTLKNIENNYMQILVEKLAEKGIESQFVRNVLCDVNMIESVSKYENAIMVEVIGESKICDIYETATQCANIRVKLLGYISVKQ